ncbi:pirin family protein [Modestobacter sp. NPDC049651]|uniref:pirin family protein n=1 Tax=unclassified Modestobacter TaxID=2643866 RepID=UPI0033C0A81F
MTLDSRVLLAPDDGSLGPLLRLADDRLAPGAGYGRHEHRDVDVVLLVLAGSLRHEWGSGAAVAAGDVAVLRAGAGLAHDEVAGPAGAHVVQTYLRAAEPGRPPRHDVVPAAAGWVDLGRPDARLWVGSGADDVPPGLRVVCRDGEVTAAPGTGPVPGPAVVCVWQLVTTRPAWAVDPADG